MNFSPKIIRRTTAIPILLAVTSALLPWYASHLRGRALEEAENGNRVEALHAAQKAIRYDPFSINSLFVLAGAQQRLGKEAEAKAQLKRATELEPLNYATWEQLALYESSYWRMQAEAQQDATKALSLNPHDAALKSKIETITTHQ